MSISLKTLDNYVVRHINGDCGPTIDGNTFDEFALIHQDGANCPIVATLRCDYGVDGTKHTLEALRSHYIPMIAGDLHLTASILNTVMFHFTSDHEFYCDAFSDEDGKVLSHPLIVIA
jgi:hypothetical protein